MNPISTTFTLDAAMTTTFTPSGAAEGVTFSIAAGSLPAGLNLSASGVLAGTPGETGTFPFAVAAKDRYGCTGVSPTYALSIVPPPTISSFTGPPAPVGPGATITLLPAFAGGTGFITSDQGHSFVAITGAEYEQTVTVTTLFTLTVTNPAGAQIATSLTAGVANVAGSWPILPPITYSCAFGLVNLNIRAFGFFVNGSTLSVTGAPRPMTGSITGNDFAASGSFPGNPTETYSVSGVFDATFTSWTGTFQLGFVGSPTYDCTNRSFTIAGDRP